MTAHFGHFVFLAFALRLVYAKIRKNAGLKPRKRASKGVFELAVGAAGGYLAGRHGSTHPCGQCGVPIGAPSRAVYCSPACRRYAQLERQETERRAARLEALGGVPEGFGS